MGACEGDVCMVCAQAMAAPLARSGRASGGVARVGLGSGAFIIEGRVGAGWDVAVDTG